MEKQTILLLEKHNVKFEYQKKFEWLLYKEKQSLDFYLPEYNIAIECQGEQHFHPVEYFGGTKTFELNLKRDKNKQKLCKKHNIKIFYLKYSDNLNDKLINLLKQNNII